MINFKQESIRDHYTFLEVIGEGAFGSVLKATDNNTGNEYAIKVIKKEDLSPEDLKNLYTEVNVTANVNHPNIVRMLDAYQSDQAYFIVFELMNGGELFDMIVEKECYSEMEAARAFRPVVDAIRYCHSKGIVHRDLKPENLLYLDENLDSTIKVSDFGLARILDSKSQLMSTMCGTPAYLAPEIIKNERYGPACDCWSLGVILYVILCGYPPFGDEANEEMFCKIKEASIDFPSPEWDEISDEAKGLIT